MLRRSARAARLGLALLLAALLGATSACSPHPDVCVRGTFGGERSFQFGNFASVVVVAPADGQAEYCWRRYHMKDGSALRPPYDVLKVSSEKGEVVVTDRGVGNGKLVVDGKERHGWAFRVHADGRVELVSADAPAVGGR